MGWNWGFAFRSRNQINPIHHIVEDHLALCGGARVYVTHWGTLSAPRECKRCRRQWERQTATPASTEASA